MLTYQIETLDSNLLSEFNHPTYTGMVKIGAARSTPLRATHPLFSAAFAVLTLKEEINLAIALGTILVVLGIALICWQREERVSSQWGRSYWSRPLSGPRRCGS